MSPSAIIIIVLLPLYVAAAASVATAIRKTFGNIPSDYAWMVVFWPVAVFTGRVRIHFTDGEDEE